MMKGVSQYCTSMPEPGHAGKPIGLMSSPCGSTARLQVCRWRPASVGSKPAACFVGRIWCVRVSKEHEVVGIGERQRRDGPQSSTCEYLPFLGRRPFCEWNQGISRAREKQQHALPLMREPYPDDLHRRIAPHLGMQKSSQPSLSTVCNPIIARRRRSEAIVCVADAGSVARKGEQRPPQLSLPLSGIVLGRPPSPVATHSIFIHRFRSIS